MRTQTWYEACYMIVKLFHHKKDTSAQPQFNKVHFNDGCCDYLKALAAWAAGSRDWDM